MSSDGSRVAIGAFNNFGGGSLRGHARIFDLSSIFTGLIFFGLLTIVTDLISLPFGMYRTFVIEEKF